VTTRRGLGRYEILEEIGRGGMATVYLARQIDLGRLVAVKELSALAASDEDSARRFVRESRLAGSLSHPNIVTVHDFFVDNATPYIAMEYLERGALRPVMEDLSFAQIAGVIEGLLAGLGHAHARGIVHRDVKPENLMIAPDSLIKIADFGIAKATGELHPSTLLTATGTTIGTPRYMAPEQALGEAVGPRTDLYAVGMIAFELFSGRLPFDTSGSPMTMLLRRVNEQPLRLDAVDATVDPRVSDWISRLLTTEPEERTQSAAAAWSEFESIVLERLGSRWRYTAPLDDLATMREVVTTPATRRMVAQTAVPEQDVATARPRTRRPEPPPRRTAAKGRTLARSLLLLIALAVIAAGALSLTPGQGSKTPVGTPGAVPTSAPAARHGGRSASSGVGDSQSDDPSDDEPDGGEP
jgi:serine/threonine protein kinase